MILNPFEIKAEILSIIDDCRDEENIKVLNSRVSRLDKQKDLHTIEKILFKELLHADTSKEKIIRFLLQRYVPKDKLVNQLWSVLKNSLTTSEVKIIVLSYLRELETDWRYEDFSSSDLGNVDLVDHDTKKLLNNALVNPEVQIDFLDFLTSVDDKDRLLLVKSLAEDYSEDALANILIPVFLSAPDSQIGKEALNILGNSHSQLAYHALNSVLGSVSERLRPLVKKNINILKLSGIREDNTEEFYKNLLKSSKPYRCCATYPDGLGNQALIFSRNNKDTGKVQFVAFVLNDYTGIRDCFGFNEISEFECDKIIERFYKDEKNVPIPPEALKTLLLYGEKISREKTSGWLLPYEYVCWKSLMADISYDNVALDSFLAKKYVQKPLHESDLEILYNADFNAHWFLDRHYSSEFEAFLEIADSEVTTKNFDFDKLITEYVTKVFYAEECIVWRERLLVCAYMEHSVNNYETAGLIYRLYHDGRAFLKFLKFVLRKSVYEYYFSLRYDSEENGNRFSLKQLDKIIEGVESKWVKNV